MTLKKAAPDLTGAAVTSHSSVFKPSQSFTVFIVGTILVSLKLPFITCYKLPNARISQVSDFIACHKFLQTLFKMV